MKRRWVCGVLGVWLLVSGGSVIAGRPLAVDDADPGDQGQFECEAGVSYEQDPDCKHWDIPFGLSYGLIQGVEIGVGFGGQLEERTESLQDGQDKCVHENGIGDLELGAKWQCISSCPLGARHALAPSIKFPTADDDRGLGSGETDYDLTWIASRSIGEKAGVHVNVGYSWIGGPDVDVLHYGLALDLQLSDSLQWVGEVVAEKALGGDSDTMAQGNTGLRWSLTDSVTLDMAGGSTLAGEGPDVIITAGLTWGFGFNTADQEQ